MTRSPSPARRIASQRCPLCGRDAARARTVYPPGSAGIGVVRCDRCDLAFATAGAAADDLGAAYAARAARDDFHDFPRDPRDPRTPSPSTPGTQGLHGRPGIARKRARLALYDRLSGGLLGRPAAAPSGTRTWALDIGCNTGLLLDALRELGYATAGIERSPVAAIAAAAGHRIDRVDIEGAEGLDRRFALITIIHVLEHLRRPIPALEWVARHLAPAGLVVIEVPNFADLARPLWGLAYRPLELGDHLAFFERATLSLALERAGLELVTLWSAPQAGSLVFPSLLSAADAALACLPDPRSPSPTRPSPSPSPEAAATTPNKLRGGGLRSRVTERILGLLDRVDPALEAAFGGSCPWGANLIAIARRPPPAPF